MSIAISSSRESNLSRRICHLRVVPLGHDADIRFTLDHFIQCLLMGDLFDAIIGLPFGQGQLIGLNFAKPSARLSVFFVSIKILCLSKTISYHYV